MRTSEDVLTVLHARQAALRRFAEGVLQHVVAVEGPEGAAVEAQRLAEFQAWFEEQLEVQVGS